MAKSVLLLLAVLAVAAVSLHAPRTVSATGRGGGRLGGPRVPVLPPAEAKKVIEAHQKFIEKLEEAELDEKIDNLSDLIQSVIEYYKEDQKLPDGFHYFKVTGIMVGGQTLPNSKGVAILSGKAFAFLDKEAFQPLTDEFPTSKPGKFGMLRTSDGGTPDSVTLLFEDGYKIEYPWHKGSGGFMILPIVPVR